VAEIGDLANSGVRRWKAQVVGALSHERRSRERFGAIHLRRTGVRDRRFRELESSQSEDPSIGCSRSRGTRMRSDEGAKGSGSSIEEDACRRSKDLANSGVRRVNVQVVGVKSRGWC
jgi:hypothetical protein